MSLNRILAFSSSRAGNGAYLETAVPVIKNFLGNDVMTIAFIPFASVEGQYDKYGSLVEKGLESLPYQVRTVTPPDAKELIQAAEAIMVGGGNTFKLLHDIYELGLLDLIRDKVNQGTPYIGWSAGSNIIGPTIGTTNDMPIIEPKSFNGLGLFPFQINPHYTNARPEGHNGETRDQRLEEFTRINPGVPVVGLPEGTALEMQNGTLKYIGQVPCILFYNETGEDRPGRRELVGADDLSFLL